MDYKKLSIEDAAVKGLAVASHAASRPNDIAVRDMLGGQITWQELNSAANKLANFF